MSEFNFFENILKVYCSQNGYQLREYSGRYNAKDCIGIVIPNGSRQLVKFVSELWEFLYNEGLDEETDMPIAIDWISEFFSNIETDSMGRDDQILYNRNFNWSEYNSEDEETDSE